MNRPLQILLRRLEAAASGALCLVLVAAARGQETSLVRTNTSDSQTVASTLTNGSGLALGLPRTIRWSIADDGAQLPNYYYAGSDPARPSVLIADLDNDYGVAAGSRGADLTTRPWFANLSGMLDRIAKKTGLTFVYEPNDDGAAIGTDGAVGVRGDLRICGGPLTGALGYNGIPTGGTQPDLVLNTSHDWSTGSDLRFISNHEYHHGLGFGHVTVESNGNASAVSPSGGNSNGPQFHDLIQLHRKYGDPYEKPAGNGSRASATSLGTLGYWQTLRVGTAWDDIWIGADETDFATISSTGDADFYQVTTTGPMVVRAVLTPKGPTYTYTTEGQAAATVDASKFMNLRLEVQNSSGSVIATAAAQPAGSAESLPDLFLPSAGSWYFRVGMDGSSTSPQAYLLEISDPALPSDPAFSFNTDGDFEGWTEQNSVATRTVSGGTLNGTISGSDPQVRRSGFNFAGSDVPNLLVRARCSVTGSFQLFWARSGADSYDAARSLTLNITQANTWTLLNFDLGSHAQWAGQTITRLRLDPPGGSGATFALDFVIGQNGSSDLVWQPGAEPGGTGNWDAATASWRLADNPLAWLAGGRALFRGTAGTVTLSNNASASALGFESGGFILDGSSTLTLAAGAEIAASTGTTTISCPLSASSLTKTGTGGLVLSGPVPALTSLDAQAGTVTFQPPADATLAAPISGAGAMAKTAATTLTLGADNSFTGPVTITAGALRLTGSGSLGTSTKTVTLTNGTAGKCRMILAGGETPITLPATISFSSSNNDPALPAVLNESGINTISGNFTLTSGGGGTRFTSQGGRLVLAGNMTPNTTGRFVHLDGAAEGTISGILQDQNTTNVLALDKTGAGIWTISGANTYTGATTIQNGTLALSGGANRLPAATVVTLGNTTTSGALMLNGNNQTLAGLLTSGTGTANRVVNGSPTAATLTIANASSNNFAGVLGGASADENNFALTKAGAGTLTLTGPNTFTGNTLVQAGSLVVAGGGAIATGAAGTALTVADGATHATTTINGGQVSRVKVNVGGATATGVGVLTVQSGSLATTGELWVGTNPTTAAFGFLDIRGGTVTSGSWLALGRGNTNSTTTTTRGLLAMSGGALNVTGGNLSIGAYQLNPSATSVMLLSGGVVTTANSVYVGEYLSGVLDMSGGTLTTGATSGLRLKTTGAGSGIVNLRGGLLTTGSVGAGSGGTSILNLNGGTLKPGQSTTTFLQGLTTANVFPGGITLDTNGQAITIAQPLLAPAGQGLASVTVAGGTGYVAPPVVDITGGGGSGATASATIDANGNLTGISVTNPGTGYTSAPTVALAGGGGSGAVIGGVTLAANAAGGLTKTGSGTLRLAGANTYTGPNNIVAGSLMVNGQCPGAVTVQPGATLGGTGTVGAATLAGTALDPSAAAPGDNGIGTLTCGGTLTLGVNSRVLWEVADWNGAAGSGYDQMRAGTLALTATPSAPLTVVVTPRSLVNFQALSRTFVLAAATTGITGFNAQAVTVDSSAFTAGSGTWQVRQNGMTLELVFTPSGYAAWVASHNLTGGNSSPAADPEHDGLPNAIEFVLGGDPGQAAPPSLRPPITVTPSTVVFVFRRTSASAYLAPHAESSSDPAGPWSPVVHGTGGATVMVEPDGFASGVDRVTVTLLRSQGSRRFLRLAVSVP